MYQLRTLDIQIPKTLPKKNMKHDRLCMPLSPFTISSVKIKRCCQDGGRTNISVEVQLVYLRQTQKSSKDFLICNILKHNKLKGEESKTKVLWVIFAGSTMQQAKKNHTISQPLIFTYTLPENGCGTLSVKTIHNTS